ncbi:hypothetical protein C2G38_2214728 [Gigaspora rosea]|uniref:Uncharacterized protein n=1 Tax=Gigaspora rosea TaxID=44941 RepID=A0A397UAL7_9GLOM|nr:hypothetical protein C2G38_2214728 [Gigaspora rosea]
MLEFYQDSSSKFYFYVVIWKIIEEEVAQEVLKAKEEKEGHPSLIKGLITKEWKTKCELVNDWKKQNGINKKAKRGEPSKQQTEKEKEKDQENKQAEEHKNGRKKEEDLARKKEAKILANLNITNLIEQGTKPNWSSWAKPIPTYTNDKKMAELTRPAAASQGPKETCLQ